MLFRSLATSVGKGYWGLKRQTYNNKAAVEAVTHSAEFNKIRSFGVVIILLRG